MSHIISFLRSVLSPLYLFRLIFIAPLPPCVIFRPLSGSIQLCLFSQGLSPGSWTSNASSIPWWFFFNSALSYPSSLGDRIQQRVVFYPVPQAVSSTMHRIPPAVVSNNASSHRSAAVVLNNALSYPSSHGGWSFNYALSFPRWLLSNNALSYPVGHCLQRIVISQFLSAGFPWWLFFNNMLSPVSDCPPNNASSPKFDPMAVVFTNASFYPTPPRLFRCLAYL